MDCPESADEAARQGGPAREAIGLRQTNALILLKNHT